MTSLICILISIILYLVVFHRKRIVEYVIMAFRAYWALKKIPGPKAYPIIGSALEFKLNSVDFTFQLESWIREFLFHSPLKNGLMSAWVGPIPLVFIILPDHIKVVLESSTLITKPSQYDKLSEWKGTGLLTSTNEKWFTRRKMLTPAFHFNVLKMYTQTFIRQREIFIDELEPYADTGREVDVFPFVKRCALDIICKTAMGTEMKTQTGMNALYVDAVVRISDIIWSHQRFPWLWVKFIWYGLKIGFEFDRLVKMTNDFTRKVIGDRRKAIEEEGMDEDPKKELTEDEVKKKKLVFLDLLLKMKEANSLTDEDIREEVDTFMFEGTFSFWSSFFLGQYPECQKKVHEELNSVFGDSMRDPNENDMKKLIYLERCIKESLKSHLFHSHSYSITD